MVAANSFVVYTTWCLLLLFGSVSSFAPVGGRSRRLRLSYTRIFDRRPNANDYYDDDDGYDDEDYDDYEPPRRRRRPSSYDDLGGYDSSRRDALDVPSAFGRRGGWRLPESVSKSLLAGVFVLGVGLGVTVDSAINTDPKDLASRDAIDQAAPNAGE